MKESNIDSLSDSFSFMYELKEYLDLNEPNAETDKLYLNKVLKQAEIEDPPDETAFRKMQEIFNTSMNEFNGLTKDQYAA